MALRVCAEPGCPALQRESRCAEHRKTTSARGYGRQHQRDRAAWVRIVAAGKTPCRRCRKVIRPVDLWDLGHPDADCDYPTAPEHRACNRATAGR